METTSLVGALALLALVIGAAAPVPRAAEQRNVATLVQPVADAELAENARNASVPASPAPVAHPKPARSPAANSTAMRRPQATDSTVAGQPDDERVALLAKTLRTDANAPVRRVAAWGLHRYAHDEVAMQALVVAAGSDADASVREMAVWALAGARRSSAASAALVKALRQDRDPKVHATSVWALGSIGDESAVEPLVGILGESDPALREMAAWSIGSCRPKRAPVALVSALADRETDVRRSAAWALYNIRDSETTGAIEAAFGRETDHEVQLGLIRALGASGESSVGALQRLVSSPDSEIRTVAVTALAGGEASGPWPWPRPEPRPFP
jgi:HEAT repeat protein